MMVPHGSIQSKTFKLRTCIVLYLKVTEKPPSLLCKLLKYSYRFVNRKIFLKHFVKNRTKNRSLIWLRGQNRSLSTLLGSERLQGSLFNEIDLLLRGVCSIFICHLNLWVSVHSYRY